MKKFKSTTHSIRVIGSIPVIGPIPAIESINELREYCQQLGKPENLLITYKDAAPHPQYFHNRHSLSCFRKISISCFIDNCSADEERF